MVKDSVWLLFKNKNLKDKRMSQSFQGNLCQLAIRQVLPALFLRNDVQDVVKLLEKLDGLRIRNAKIVEEKWKKSPSYGACHSWGFFGYLA